MFFSLRRNILFLYIIHIFSCTGKQYNYEECRLTFQITVKWVGCRPFIFRDANHTKSNKTGVSTQGIIQSALEIIQNHSNLTFYYEDPSSDSAQSWKSIQTYKGSNNLIIIPSVPMDLASLKFSDEEDEHENSFHGKCKGKFCATMISDSYGPVLMIKKTVTPSMHLIANGLKKCWKSLVVTLLLAGLAGILLWGAERNKNSDEFPKDFITGSWHGFWWALVTMTTVGYGDKSPRSIPGRLVTICWMIIGMIFFSILTGTMAGALFEPETSNDVTMFGKKVAVLRDSAEVQIALSEIAYVVEYDTIDDIVEAIRNDSIKFVLLDRFIVNSYLEEFSSHDFKVNKLVNKLYSYYVFLVGKDGYFAKKVSKCIQKLNRIIMERAQKFKTELSKEWVKTKHEPETLMGIQFILYLSVSVVFLICIGVIWQFLHSRNKSGKDKNGEFPELGMDNLRKGNFP